MATVHHNNRPGSVRSVAIEDKAELAHIEDNEVDEKQAIKDPNADYSGFTQKTDPAEIKLVRKLDLYIMVS
jgi:hypothetical protein